ncbi:5-(carboxyamino)imidazole ribonucleotide synthase [Vulcanibacillus modesticaldus]|uniref:N5-carboxyaminoimidazole ribonucleotide synthase n=1 Tax=Vulcanibacillus modesticaldus TaxID=337097 RepID=A0A1D2YUY8_9BACI|nr:5-(carboxyamino)imidazole ribonucleotide synthase [Vulcanibacillus modesticaldus]OEF99481.1 5-(carboxyamino)imidazole ribonucleotide synthase [Vulcanibacillus modesticaldus]
MGELILPGKTIGIIGGGQLGKMLSVAAQTLGYRVIVWSEESDCPACNVATSTVVGSFSDQRALNQFVEVVDVATVETEHIPITTLRNVSKFIPLYPDPEVIAIAQNRRNEKGWLAERNFPVAPFLNVWSVEEVINFHQKTADEVVVKTITGGYDGKGQMRLSAKKITEKEIVQIQEWLKRYDELVIETWLQIKGEFSVIAARNKRGSFVPFPVVENEHKDHILHRTIAPARLDKKIVDKAISLTKEIMEQMDYVGLLCVEFFQDQNGEVYINELAPRPHNSGHYTLDIAVTSQFEQTIRAITGLPLGDTRILSSGVMVNLLGDLWEKDFQVEKILSESSTKLHLYGKKEARPKRKMGHFTTIANTVDLAIEKAEKLYKSLS